MKPKHIIKTEWTGVWKDKYVITCSCGFTVSGLRNGNDVDKAVIKHLEKSNEPNLKQVN